MWNDVETLRTFNWWLGWISIALILVGGVGVTAAKLFIDRRVSALERERGNQLKQELEDSRRRVAELEQRTAPWRLSAAQREHLRAALVATSAAQAVVVCRFMDGESCDLARDLATVLKDVGWTIFGPGANSLNDFFGVNVFGKTGSGNLAGVDHLLAALTAAGIQCLSQPVAPNSIGGPIPAGTIAVIVGRRPK
jgi:hypothetical protein